jgi:hypothetical protein
MAGLVCGLSLCSLAAAQNIAAPGPAAPQGAAVGVVSHIKVLSDKVEDVSSLEAWKRSFIKDTMTDKERALAIFNSVVKFRTESSPPIENLGFGEKCVHDTIKMFNVYGYNMCCCSSANMEQLARYVGMPTRGWGVTAHSIAEFSYDNAWHMLDPEWIVYFPDDKGNIFGVDEINKDVTAWMNQNAALRKDTAKQRDFAANDGWKKGPAAVANCPFFDSKGQNPTHTKGWWNVLNSYDTTKAFLYEYGYSQGYEVNIQLRPGEKITRNWSNKGLHINMDGAGAAPSCLTGRGTMMRYQSDKLGDIAPGRLGNGVHEYQVPLGDPSFRATALAADNLASKADDGLNTALHVKDAAKPGVLVIDMPSSYVYLTGEVNLAATVGAGGSIKVQLSDNNGLDWADLTTIDKSGPVKIDLKKNVFCRYDYRLRFEISGAQTGLEGLNIRHDIQHSQAPLPALGQGDNTITFSAGPDEGTLTLEGSCDPSVAGKQLTLASFHPELSGLDAKGLTCTGGGKGEATFKIATPGDMVRLRIGGFYRARAAKDGYDMQVSFDEGKTFATFGRLAGPYKGNGGYAICKDIPAGTRQAQVRLAGNQQDTIMMFDLRIDADYKQPAGGFRPIKVTYVWDEDGKEQRDEHIAASPNETYTIKCAGKPTMKSIILEVAK